MPIWAQLVQSLLNRLCLLGIEDGLAPRLLFAESLLHWLRVLYAFAATVHTAHRPLVITKNPCWWPSSVVLSCSLCLRQSAPFLNRCKTAPLPTLQSLLSIKDDAQLLKARGLQATHIQAKSTIGQPLRDAANQTIGEDTAPLSLKKGLRIPNQWLRFGGVASNPWLWVEAFHHSMPTIERRQQGFDRAGLKPRGFVFFTELTTKGNGTNGIQQPMLPFGFRAAPAWRAPMKKIDFMAESGLFRGDLQARLTTSSVELPTGPEAL